LNKKQPVKSPVGQSGTITEIYDFLRLLYARTGIAYSYNTGEAMVKYTDEQIIGLIIEKFRDQKVYILGTGGKRPKRTLQGAV